MERRVTKKKQAENARFKFLMETLLTKAGAVSDESEPAGTYRFTLATKYGVLRLHVTENYSDGPGTVFTRFDDQQASEAGLGCNPHSGKWNHHYFSCWTIESAVKDLVYQLNKVLISPVVFDPETVALPGRGRKKPKQENAEPCLSKST